MTGEKKAPAEPAQAKTLSSLEAPKATKQATNTNELTADETDGAAEAIDPSTGEIIVLAQRKADAEAGVDASSAVTARSQEQVTVLAKPEKRKNAKQKAEAKFAKKFDKAESEQNNPAKDGTTPDMTATAKSKAGAKSAEVLAANEARKERKAEAKGKAKAKDGAKAGAKPKAKKAAR